MDPLSAAGTFATIVGLLSNYKSEKSSTELNSFIEWLKAKHYEEISSAIERNASLSQELSKILATNHSDLVQHLKRLDSQITFLASKLEGFGGLAKALNLKPALSEQAISILRQLTNSGAEYFMEHKIYTGEPDEYQIIGGTGGDISCTDHRFIKDDLNSLVAANLLRLEHASRGSRQFFITRAAVEFFQ